MDRIDEIKLETDEHGYYLDLTGDFVKACQDYLEHHTGDTLSLRIGSLDLIRFAKEVTKTDDYFYLSPRV